MLHHGKGFGGLYDGWGKKTVMSLVWTAKREGCYGFRRFDKRRPQACYCQVSPGIDKVRLLDTHSELCMLVNSSSDIIGNKFHSYAEYYARGCIHTSTIHSNIGADLCVIL